MANGERDERQMLMFPKTRVGHGCPSCAEEYNRLVVEYSRSRTPFILVRTM